jgi:hypothetical protein
MSLLCAAAFCLVATGSLQAVQPTGNDQVVEKLIALLSQYNGMEFEVEQVFDSPRNSTITLTCLVSNDGTESIVEKTYPFKDGKETTPYYCNRDYSYSVGRTPTNVFYATATTKPNAGRNNFIELGHSLVFFLGKTFGGQRISDFFVEASPVVTILPQSGEARRYSVSVESKTEGLYRFEVSETEDSFQLMSVVVEETPESISSKNGQSVDVIGKVFRKRRLTFKDIEMRDGKIVAFSSEPALDELPDGKTKPYGYASRVTVTSSSPLTDEIVRSTEMFSLFVMPERISTVSMLCGSQAPHAIVNGSLVRLDVP